MAAGARQGAVCAGRNAGIASKRSPEARLVRETGFGRKLFDGLRARLEQHARRLDSHAIDEGLWRAGARELQAPMQRAFGGGKRVRQIERGKRGVAGFADDPLRLDDKGVQSRQITLWAIDRGIGSGLAEKDGISGDARRLLAAKPPDRMQREVHPGERRPGGRDTPILDERRAARDIGARIAALELIQPP